MGGETKSGGDRPDLGSHLVMNKVYARGCRLARNCYQLQTASDS